MANVQYVDCQHPVPPYWDTLRECTSETCHRPLPCPVHVIEVMEIKTVGDSEVTGSKMSPIEVSYVEYDDSRPEYYYKIQVHNCIHTLTPERTIDLYNKLDAELRTIRI